MLALAHIVARDHSPLPDYMGILLIVAGAYLKFSEKNPDNEPHSWQSFIEGFRPLPQCKKAFIQMWVGVALIFSGMFFLYLYSQTERAVIAFFFVTAPTVAAGLYLFLRYPYCLQKNQDDRTVN